MAGCMRDSFSVTGLGVTNRVTSRLGESLAATSRGSPVPLKLSRVLLVCLSVPCLLLAVAFTVPIGRLAMVPKHPDRIELDCSNCRRAPREEARYSIPCEPRRNGNEDDITDRKRLYRLSRCYEGI